MSNEPSRVGNATLSTSGAPWADLTPEQIVAQIKAAMEVVKTADPIANFFLARGIDVKTHDVVFNHEQATVWTNPPDYIKFSKLVEPGTHIAVKRFDLNTFYDTSVLDNKHRPTFGSNLGKYIK